MNADHPVISHPTFLSSSLMSLKKVTIIPNNPPDNVTTTSANFLKASLRIAESSLNLSLCSSVMDLIFGVDRLNVNGGVLLWFVLNCFAERKARAPLPAAARVDYRVWVVVAGNHRN